MTRLTARQQAALDALLTAPTMTAAAAAVGISRRTLYNWLEDPTFQAALADLRAESLTLASLHVARLTVAALDQLEQAMTADPPPPWTVRLRAAEAVLGNSLRMQENYDFERRLTVLEQQAAEERNRETVPSEPYRPARVEPPGSTAARDLCLSNK